MVYGTKATLISSMEALNSYYDGTVDALQNHAYVANKIVNNDTFTFSEVKQHPERASFVEAMIAEINDHEERNHWELIDRMGKFSLLPNIAFTSVSCVAIADWSRRSV